MKKLTKTIFTGFAPNLTKKDVAQACSFLFLPWKWKKIRFGAYSDAAVNWLKKYFSVQNVFLLDSGRSGIFLALKALGVKDGDEVLVQAYTCIVVINAIVWAGAKPVYVDIDGDFNMNYEDLRKKISQKTKVVIIQHTFGKPANLNKILEIARQYQLKTIEDCAHSLGANYQSNKTGTFADIGMFSFGSDKIISCVRGGALITGNNDLAEKINVEFSKLPTMKLKNTIQHLVNLPIFYLGKKTYSFGIGKAILAFTKKINIVNRIIYPAEKRGVKIDFFPCKMANSLTGILLSQLDNINNFNQHRKLISEYYQKNIINPKIIKPGADEDSVSLRFCIRIENPAKLHNLAKQNNIILGNWYSTVIAPPDIDNKKTFYQSGSCPNAEKMAAESINLPTDYNITLEDAKKIVDIVNKY